MANELVIQETGEIIERPQVDMATAIGLARAEIDMQVATARAYPRSVARAVKRIVELATLDEETAEGCCYVLIRKKKGKRGDDDEAKPIEGPSIRLAEIAAQCWGNARTDARVISVNRKEMWVEAEGIFHDLETNMAWRKVARRNIRTSGGYLFSEDMINVTGMAACAIAQRNAILAGIPNGVVMQGYTAAKRIVKGDATTLGANRKKVYDSFARHGVTPEQIHELLSVGGEADITLDHIALLRATFASIKNGEATVTEVFGKKEEPKPQGVVDPLGSSKKTPSSVEAKSPLAETGTAGEATTPVSSPATTESESDAKDRAFVDGETRPSDAAPTEPARGQSQPEVAKEPEKTEATPAGKPAAPTTPVEYMAHVRAYVAAAADHEALDKQWHAEKPLRTKLGVRVGQVADLEGEVKAKYGSLRSMQS